MLNSLEQSGVIFLVVVGLIAFRLFFGLPFLRPAIKYFPAPWQRWLYDEPEMPGKTPR